MINVPESCLEKMNKEGFMEREGQSPEGCLLQTGYSGRRYKGSRRKRTGLNALTVSRT